LYDDILSCLEQGKSFVDITITEYKKAFDLIRHHVVLENVSEMSAKMNLLLIVADLLSGHEQCGIAVGKNDTNSSFLPITCGVPQGTKLAGIVFLAIKNYILRSFKDRYKFMDDLSFLLK
jgi:hypothetical protein